MYGAGVLAVMVSAGLYLLRGPAAMPQIVIVAAVYFVFWMILSSGGMRAMIIALAVALPFRWGVGEPYKIPSGSMEPTLHGDERPFRGDRVFVNKFVYGWRWPFNRSRVPMLGYIIDYADSRIWNGAKPQRFDVVVFKSPEEDPRNMTLIKRVIGLPGEHVNIREGCVYIDGKPLTMPDDLSEVYYTRPSSFSEPAYYGIREDDRYARVPEGHYLVLGDNSGNSRDGRFWGWVPEEHILGRATCIWWPPSRMRDFTGFTHSWVWRGAALALALALGWRMFIGRFWRVGPEPMIHGVKPFERLYIDRLALGVAIPLASSRILARSPNRGDAVLYLFETANTEEPLALMGWVAGLPGDQVTFDGGTPMINGAPVDGPLRGHAFAPRPSGVPVDTGDTPTTVPDRSVFVLADSEKGMDSRDLGCVPCDHVIGVARYVWWPIGNRRRIAP
ncbi:MAG: hypothetical protein AMXMBFR84_10090 [Candidatus Hydrogenedentota bacterium]